MRAKIIFLLTFFLLTTALLTACGDDANNNNSNGLAADVTPNAPSNADELSKLSGTLKSDGSSTVYRITFNAAKEFKKLAPNVQQDVKTSGTSAGFRRFCNGDLDIQNASRPISVQEALNCKNNNVEFIELPIAYDGLAVVVNINNSWVDYLTVAELKKIWQPEAEKKITTWNQVRSSFPSRPIRLHSPGTDSGTFDYFTAAIVGTEKAQRTDVDTTENDYSLVAKVAAEPEGISYFGYAYVPENKDKLKAVPIKVKDEAAAVAPSVETVKNGSYQPLSRPLFLYIKRTAADRPEIKAFVNYYLSKSFTPLIQSQSVGYIALPDSTYTAIAKRFSSLTTGTLFPKGEEIGATLDRYLASPNL